MALRQLLSTLRVRRWAPHLMSPSLEDITRDLAAVCMSDIAPLLTNVDSSSFRRDIHTLTLADTAAYSVVVFLLPPHARLPLHDHPSMTVRLRVLHGGVRIRSFDWAPAPPSAVLVDDSVVTPEDAVIGFSAQGGGVVHSVEATSDGGVFIDFITPPYGVAPSFIECTYFREEGGAQKGTSAVLHRLDPPPYVPMVAIPSRRS